MSSGVAEPERKRSTRYLLFALIGGAVVLLLLIVLTLSGIGARPATTTNQMADDNPLANARDFLERDPDLNASRSALQQINSYLGGADAKPVPALDPDLRKKLGAELGLNEDELNEAASTTYTLLDGWHLSQAFLLHDVVDHALELEPMGAGASKADLLERARTGFAWTTREVRLAEPPEYAFATKPGTPPAGDVTPPELVLRRGSGTPLERALVFLALLDQLAERDAGAKTPPLLGCLVYCPDKPEAGKPAGPPRLWACGVLVNGGPEVYLFDPRLGLPLPGKDGKGVADLAAVCRDPALLDQLNLDDGPHYDTTSEQARKAELQLVRSLSALAPRMRHLQDELLAPAVPIHLADDPLEDLDILKKAAKPGEGLEFAVKAWSEGPKLSGAGVLRRFLPPDQGGADAVRGFKLSQLRGFTEPTPDEPAVQMQRYSLFRMELAPWDVMPRQLRDQSKFPYNVSLGQRVRDGFSRSFYQMALEPQGPRDLLLRGRFDKAAIDLTQEDGKARELMKQRDEAVDLEKRVDEWAAKAQHIVADQLRARDPGTPANVAAAAERNADQVWKEVEPVVVLLQGAAGVPTHSNITYLLGLCKHEKAGQMQRRLDRAARAGMPPTAEQIEEVRTAWRDAVSWQRKYADEHPPEEKGRPSTQPGRAAAARRLCGEAQAMLGEWDQAARTWKDTTEPMEPLEKVAVLYLARETARRPKR